MEKKVILSVGLNDKDLHTQVITEDKALEEIVAILHKNGIKLNTRKYSRTTSIIQNTIKNECNVVEEYIGEVAYIW